MSKYLISFLFLIAAVAVVSSAPQYAKSVENISQASERDNADDLDEGANKEDLKGSASYGYGYYGYPLGGYYTGYPFSYGLQGYYGGFSPYYGGHGFHGHYY